MTILRLKSRFLQLNPPFPTAAELPGEGDGVDRTSLDRVLTKVAPWRADVVVLHKAPQLVPVCVADERVGVDDEKLLVRDGLVKGRAEDCREVRRCMCQRAISKHA